MTNKSNKKQVESKEKLEKVKGGAKRESRGGTNKKRK